MSDRPMHERTGRHVAETVSRREMRDLNEEQIRLLAAKHDVVGDVHIDRFVPPGPVAQAFILDRVNKTKVLMGPLGGGKTTTCAFARIVGATWQPLARHPEDGRPTRLSRWLVLRDTFRNAEKSVLESWRGWFPKTYPGSTWAGGNDRPVTHTLRWRLNGERVEAVTEFAGLNDHDIEVMMKGREYDGVWLNEVDTHADGAIEDGEMRVGRYPRPDLLLDPDARRMAFVIGDMNAPTIDNWTYDALMRNVMPGRVLYRQPSGTSPEAENLFNLEPDYYTRLVAAHDDAFVQRMVHNRFGYSRSGKPVLPMFDRLRHVAREPIAFDPDADLLIGVDTSINTLNPAAVFGQVARSSRIRMFDEIYADEHGMGATRFAERLKMRIADRYPNARKIRLWADPAAQYGADREGGQLDAIEKIAMILGLPVLLPFNGSNELGQRIDAWKMELRGHTEADTHILFCPVGCPSLIQAIEGKYRYRKRPEKAASEWEEIPEKNHPWSDLADAGGYLIGGVRGRSGAQRAAAGMREKNAGETPWGAKRRTGFDVHRVGR